MANTRRAVRRTLRWAVSGCAAAALVGTSIASAAADPTPVVPSAAQVAAAQAAAASAATQASVIDAELAAARATLQDQQERAGAAAEEYNRTAEELDEAIAQSTEATTKALAAAVAADEATLALSRYAAEVFQSGGGLGQLDVFFGAGGPGLTLERAAGLEAVGEERARVMREATEARRARDIAQRDNDAAAAAAASVATRQEQALAQLATLRNTSVELERQRQDGLAAIEAARIAEEARRKAAEEAARKAAEEAAARKAAEEAAARKAAEEAARKKAEEDAKKAASSPTTAPKTSTSSTTKPTTSPTSTPSPSTPVGPAPAPKAGVDAVIAFARAQLGEPYVWASAGPDSWDCSGLTMMAWAQAGVKLSHYTGSQYKQTARVPVDELKPGDLVFFGPSVAGIHHVGLYIGNGQMIHAPYTGTVVKISTIWRKDLIPYGGRP